MGSNEEGKQGRVLDCLDTSRFAQEPIALTLGKRRAEDIVRPGIPAEIQRPAQPREPGSYAETEQSEEDKRPGLTGDGLPQAGVSIRGRR